MELLLRAIYITLLRIISKFFKYILGTEMYKAPRSCSMSVGLCSEGAPSGFAFDRGCFHTLNSDEERKNFAENVAAYLEKGGLWLSIIGNADEQRDNPGPPQRTARDIVNSVEPYFEILSLVSSQFESNRSNPPRAWVCLMRKRHSA